MLYGRLVRPAARVSLPSPLVLTFVPILFCTAALGQDAGTNSTEPTTSSPSTAAPTSTTESSRTTASSSPDVSSISFGRPSIISFAIGFGFLLIVFCLLPRQRRRSRRHRLNPAVRTQTSPLTPPPPSNLAPAGAPSSTAVPPPPPPPFAVSNSHPVAMRVLTPAGPGVVYAIPVPPPPPSTLGMHAVPAPLPAAAFPPLPHQHHHHHQRRRPRFDVSTLNSFEVAEDSRDDACPICLGPLHEEKVSVGPCLHIAHTSCLKQWLTKDADSTCPVCRVSFASGNDAGAGDREHSAGANSSAQNGGVGLGQGAASPALMPLPPLPPLPPSLHARNSFPHAFHSRLAAPPPVGAPVSQQEQPLSLPPPPPVEVAHAPTEAAEQQEQRHQTSSDQSVDVATVSYPQTTNPVLPHEAPSGGAAQGALQQQQQQEIQLPPPPPPV